MMTLSTCIHVGLSTAMTLQGKLVPTTLPTYIISQSAVTCYGTQSVKLFVIKFFSVGFNALFF